MSKSMTDYLISKHSTIQTPTIHMTISMHSTSSGTLPRSRYTFSPGRESWIAITAVVLSLTLSHLVQRIAARRRNRRECQRIQITSRSSKHPSTPHPFTWIAAVRAQATSCLYLYVLPSWLYAPETVCDAIWTGVYCIVMVCLAVYQCPFTPKEYPYLYLANRLGILAYAQTPLIFLLAVKNNPLSPLTGITYQKLNYLHRASARACILFAWAHAGLWFLPVLYAGHLFHWYIIWGTVALVSFSGLWAASIRSLRRRSFELFLVTHILFSAAFILGAILHWPLKAYWIWPALAVWVLDRIVRLIRLIYINQLHRRHGAITSSCVAEVVSKDVMRVTIIRPGLKWEAGQHFFISSPDTGCMTHESHPFSIANMPNSEDKLIFLIRAHNGFTRRLYTSSHSHPRLLLEGPYGHSHSFSHFDTVLLVSGGTGVTFTLSYFLSLLSEARRGKGSTKRIKLLWHVRHADDVYWITGILDEALQGGRKDERGLFGGLEVDVEVWVTRSSDSGEPWDTETSPSTSEYPATGSTVGEDKISRNNTYAPTSPPLCSPLGGSQREMAEVNEMTRLLPSLKANMVPAQDTLGGTNGSSSIVPVSSTSSCSSTLGDDVDLHRYRPISPAVQQILSVHAGRADLSSIVQHLAHQTDLDRTASEDSRGGMIVVACGPVQLMTCTRRAVAEVNGWDRIRKGGVEVEYFEETVGH